MDQASRTQAHVTHHNALSDAGTLAVIRMVQAGLLGGDRSHLKDIAESLVAVVGVVMMMTTVVVVVVMEEILFKYSKIYLK